MKKIRVRKEKIRIYCRSGGRGGHLSLLEKTGFSTSMDQLENEMRKYLVLELGTLGFQGEDLQFPPRGG